MITEAWVEAELLKTCNNCEDDIYQCDGCKDGFNEGEKVFCDEVPRGNSCKHYCEKCHKSMEGE